MENKLLTRTVITIGHLQESLKKFAKYLTHYVPIVCRYFIFNEDKSVRSGYWFVSLFTLNIWQHKNYVYVYAKPLRTYCVCMNSQHQLLRMGGFYK